MTDEKALSASSLLTWSTVMAGDQPRLVISTYAQVPSLSVAYDPIATSDGSVVLIVLHAPHMHAHLLQ